MTQFNDAFWRWFGDSKVVDGAGKPLVVYHATEAKFEVFNIDKCELGCHFGSSEQSQAILPEERGYAIAAYLSIQNPLRLEDENYWDSATVTAQLVKRGLMSRVFRGEPGWKMREMLVKMGYDGIVYDNRYECCGDSWIAFYPEQIKSATGNDGSWDSDDPDITSNPQEAGNPNRDFLQQPTYEDMGRALDVSKRPYIGAHLSLPDGYPVGLRIDIPAFERHGIYVITVHEKASRGAVGKRIGYGSAARILNPVFFSVKSGAAKIAGGHAKFPVATVEGLYINDTSTPEDIDEWTPVGYNPRKALFFYEKDVDSSGRVSVGREVMSGDEAILVGNTVFVKSAVFSPTQIKSATGNDGTWDRDDPDITSNPPVRFAKKWVAGYCGDFMEILSDALASRGIQARRKGVLASDGRVHHVVLQIGDKLIDARGVLTKEELFAELAAQGGALQPTALVPLTEAHLSGFKCASEEDLDALSEEIELWVENDLLRAL